MDLVSIIIPTYKGSLALARAVDSALNQSYEAIEVIVVDDNNPGSRARKDTENIMERYKDDERVIYKKHYKNKNGAAARNTGISCASGVYITFLDDDDYYLPERVEYSVRYMESNKSMIGVYVGVNLIDANDNIVLQVRPNKKLEISDLLKNEMVLGTGSNIFLYRDVVNSISGFDTCFVRRQDIEFMIRVCKKGTVGFIPNLMVIKSVNGTMNHPNYSKMKETIEQFTEKFYSEIESLGKAQERYYVMQYRTLFGIALYEHNVDEIREAKNLIKKHGHITLKENILAFLYIYNIRDSKVVSFIFRFQSFLKSCVLMLRETNN